MNRTFRISFSLKNTYRVNSILYGIKQIPLIKRLLPETLYGVRGLKIFANILSGIWEIVMIFLGKFLYVAGMIYGLALLYDQVSMGRLFMHIFFFLTVIGAFTNTYMFNPSRDKYYAMILMRMDARAYTLVNYGYALLRVILGFLPFTLFFGRVAGAPWWFCWLAPFFVAGLKLTMAMIHLMI